MNVTFGQNFWGSRRRENASEMLSVEKTFSWADREWRIPAVYRCKEGLVVDLCMKVPAGEIEQFSLDFFIHGKVNGQPLRGKGSCSVCWHPQKAEWEAKEAGADDVEEELMDTYACDRSFGWKFIRKSFGWDEDFDGMLKSLELTLEREARCYPGPRFQTRLGEPLPCVELVHPVTGSRYVLTVERLEQDAFSEEMIGRMRSVRVQMEQFPTHFLQLSYTLEPELPAAEFSVKDCEKNDSPIMRGNSAGAVSLIGGADGPTSVFVAGKEKNRRPEQRTVCSSLHYESVKNVVWGTEFWIKEEEIKKVMIRW